MWKVLLFMNNERNFLIFIFFMNNTESFSVKNAYSESNSNGKMKLLLSVKRKKHKSIEMICFFL